MLKIMLRAINWRHVWFWMKYPIFAFGLLLAVWLMFGCAAATRVEKPKVAADLKDPLETDQNQRQSVAMYLKKYGEPVLFWSYSDDDFKFEVYYWPQSEPQRWASKLNGKYKLTWTQFKKEK